MVLCKLDNYCKNTITSTQPTILPWRFGLYQRPSSEEVCSIPLPVLATIVMRHGKKSVVRVAQRVAPLVPVQWLRSFFPNMYCLFDPSSTFVGFSVQNSGGWPIDHVVVMRCMVSQCWFVLLRQTWCDARWFLVKGLLVMDSTSVLCFFNLVPYFLPVSPM